MPRIYLQNSIKVMSADKDFRDINYFSLDDLIEEKIRETGGGNTGNYLKLDQSSSETVINGLPTFQDGIRIGTSDTSLYRASANTLQTDDTFTINGGSFNSIGTGANNLTYNGVWQIITSDQTDQKVFQIRNDLNTIGIITAFLDAEKSGGFSVDQYDGNTTVKLRGRKDDHSYLQNKYVSIGRGGQSVDAGSTVNGAMLTLENNLWARDTNKGYGDPNNYMMVIKDNNNNTNELAIGFSNSNKSNDNIGAAIVFVPTGGNAQGQLDFYTKAVSADGTAPLKNMSITSPGDIELTQSITKYNNSSPVNGQVLIGNTSTGKFEAATLTQGNSIEITNAGGEITIEAKLSGYTVATLPSGALGRVAFVTDADTPTFGDPVVGGGSTKIPVFYNGSNWIAY